MTGQGGTGRGSTGQGNAGQPAHVAVIGCGIVGSCTALALQQRGCRVTLLEPASPGGQQAASYGNGAFISPASIIPMSMPGLWKNVPRYLADPLGPLTIRWRDLPGLAPWLARFLVSGCTPARVRRTARLLNGLLHDGPERHGALALAHGCKGLIRQDGLIYAYPDRSAFVAESLAWDVRRENGLAWQEMDNEALHALEPAIGPGYSFAIFVGRGAYCTDPGGYVGALADAARAGGAELRQARATGFEVRDGRLQAVRTDRGDLACDRAVVAAGIHSRALARSLGDRVPLVSERGYHVQLPGSTGGPTHPVLPSDGKMGIPPLPGGLRASGQVELARVDAPPDWRRADILLQNLRQTYPALKFDPARVMRWQGNRPSTPDGLPVIGPSAATQDVIYAFGHGHVGLAAGPKTADIVAALFTGGRPPIDAAPFAASRF